ncbi:MAG: hypothetical protein ACOX7B_03290 [Christensenellales bacterium]|jgi:hypothetical protein
MRDIKVSIEFGGLKEDLVFTTAALMEVQEKFGDITAMTEAFSGLEINEWDDEEAKAKKLKLHAEANVNALPLGCWLVTILANQGRWLKDPKAEKLTEEYVALHTAPMDLQPMLQACMDAIAKGMGTYHQEEEAPIDPILEEVEKNAESAEA